jgi:UDP-N-acetylglucosamine 2-epimerase (non-hydrolysing)
VIEAMEELAGDLPIVFAMHPRSKHQLVQHGHLAGPTPASQRGIVYIDPLGYLDFVALLSRARLVLTDSGGIQEETTVLQVPCLTLRTSTERPITVTHGTNRVIGTDARRIVEEARLTLSRPPRPVAPPPLWDGRASHRIVQILAGSRWVAPTGPSAGADPSGSLRSCESAATPARHQTT